MILPIALLAVLSWRQTTTVSFTCRAEPLLHLVVELSKATGLKLAVSKACANDVLIISVQDVPVDKLLAEIAKVDAGAWVKEGELMRFSADSASRRAEARAELALRANIVKAGLRRAQADALKKETESANSEDGSKIPDLRGMTPAEAKLVKAVLNGATEDEAILSLLENADAEVLVLQREGRVVLSTRPTAMQGPLDSGAEAAIGDLIEKRNAAAKLLEAVAARAQAAGGSPTAGADVQPILGYSKADLVVTDLGAPDAFLAALTLYAADGGIVFQANTFVSNGNPAEDFHPTTSTKIEISDAAKAFRSMYRSERVPNTAIVAVPPAIVPYFTDAEHNDPLALTPSDDILALARSQKAPLVAVVPDTAFVDTLPVGETITLEEFSQSLATGDTMTIRKAGDWIEIKPAFPDSARQYRCDRSDLGPFMRACMKESIPTLDEFADFAATTDVANNDVVTAYVATAVGGYGNGGLGTLPMWNLYRVFGEFSPAQRASLISGAKLPFSVLTSGQQAYFYQFAYGGSERLRYGTAPAPLAKIFPSARPLDDGQQGIQRDGLPPMQGFEDEPTELLPNGAQPTGYIEMKIADEPFVSPDGPTTTPLVVPRVLGVAQMANRQVRSNQPDFGKNGAIRFDKYKLGSRRLHVLTIHGSDRTFVSGRLYDFHLFRDSPDFSMSDLSSDWQDEVSRRVNVLQQRQAAEDRKTAPPP